MTENGTAGPRPLGSPAGAASRPHRGRARDRRVGEHAAASRSRTRWPPRARSRRTRIRTSSSRSSPSTTRSTCAAVHDRPGRRSRRRSRRPPKLAVGTKIYDALDTGLAADRAGETRASVDRAALRRHRRRQRREAGQRAERARERPRPRLLRRARVAAFNPKALEQHRGASRRLRSSAATGRRELTPIFARSAQRLANEYVISYTLASNPRPAVAVEVAVDGFPARRRPRTRRRRSHRPGAAVHALDVRPGHPVAGHDGARRAPDRRCCSAIASCIVRGASPSRSSSASATSSSVQPVTPRAASRRRSGRGPATGSSSRGDRAAASPAGRPARRRRSSSPDIDADAGSARDR